MRVTRSVIHHPRIEMSLGESDHYIYRFHANLQIVKQFSINSTFGGGGDRRPVGGSLYPIIDKTTAYFECKYQTDQRRADW